MPKSGAERSKVYRVKKRLEAAPGVKKEKRPPKTSAERAREYRARKKALKDAMSKFDLALSVESDFGGLSSSKCASLISGSNEPWHNEYTYGLQNVNLKATPAPPALPTCTSIPAEIELKQSPSPPSTPPQTHPQYDFADDSQSESLKNYPSGRDSYDIFGEFIASELRGLENNFQLVRAVKKKIQLAILEAYDIYQKQCSTEISPHKEDVTLQQSQLPEEPHVKIEYTDDDDQNANRSSPTYQESQQLEENIRR